MTKEEQQAYINKLGERKAKNSFESTYIMFVNKEGMEPYELFNVLTLDKSLLNRDGIDAIEYLESLDETDEEMFSFRKFKWKIMAFLSVQDLLNVPVFGENAINVLLKMKYFYYESKYILSEVILASLNGLHIGNKQLLRNFLEFNLQQCYFINRVYKDNSYQAFEEYLKTKIPPSQAKLINSAFPEDNFCKPIKKRVQLEFDHLSNRYSHAYNLEQSPKNDGIFRPGFTIDSLYFYIQISATLDVVLWTYYVNFPMLFRPVDITRKFGFSPPSLFVTPDVTFVIEKTMSADDFKAFRQNAQASEMANAHMEWYNSLPDLSEEEIWADPAHPREGNESVTEAYLKMLTLVRAYSEFVYETPEEKQVRIKKVEEFDLGLAEYYVNFTKWQKIYKHVGKSLR
jgi:hypothetical protein